MSYREIPLTFECEGCRLVGIVAMPKTPLAVGVLIVVGGPQYRPGSHRQFTLLARDLADNGIPSMRFDYRGMGDSEGDMRTFECVDADLRSAIDTFLAIAHNVRQVTIWGLCDAASAALMYAHTDPRVTGIVLLNPWVHNKSGAGRVRLKYYYVARFLQKSFWSKLFSGQVSIINSAMELCESARQFFVKTPSSHESHISPSETLPYTDRMLAGIQRYTGKILLILSGNDLVARGFDELMLSDKRWKTACETDNVEKHWLYQANHTFSTHKHRDEVSKITRQWVERLLSLPNKNCATIEKIIV